LSGILLETSKETYIHEKLFQYHILQIASQFDQTNLKKKLKLKQNFIRTEIKLTTYTNIIITHTNTNIRLYCDNPILICFKW